MTDIQAAADGIATTASHPVTVQVINQSPGIMGNVVTGLITGALTGGVALAGIWLTHFLTLRRERRAAEDKLQRERYFIVTELVFMLEQFAEGCAQVATDDGRNNQDRQPEREAEAGYPELNLTDVSGDWRVLDPHHMYRIRELPVLQNEARRAIAYAREIPVPPLHEYYFWERQYQFTRLGLKAAILSVRLRRATGLPDTHLADGEWSAVSRLRKVWRRERRRRTAEAVSNREWNEPVLSLQDDTIQ